MPMKTRTPGVAAAGRHLRLVAGGAEPSPLPDPSPPFPFPAGPAPYLPLEPGRPAPPPSVEPAAASEPVEPLPIGVSALPAAAWRAIVADLARAAMVRELEQLRERCAALEHENRRLAAAVEAARAEGERVERERTVRTMGHRLPSILTGGR